MRISILWISLFLLPGYIFNGPVYGQEADTQSATQSEFSPGEAHLIPVALPPVTPTNLASDQAKLKLPGVFSQVVVGGNGRYLIFYLKQQKQLAVFDVSAAKIIQQIPILFEDISVAAGADKLVVISRDQFLIARYSLKTFEKELTRPFTVEGKGPQLTMGSASNGPILVTFEGGSRGGNLFLDLNTLEKSRIDLPSDWGRTLHDHSIVHAAPGGQVFSICRKGTSPPGLTTIRIQGNTAEVAYRHDTSGVAVPSRDGSLMFNAMGIYDPLLREVADEACLNSGIPPVYSDFYFVRGANGKTFQLHRGGQSRPIATIAAPGPEILPVVKDRYGRTVGGVSKEAESFLRHYYIEQAQVLIYLPDSNDEVVLQHFDLEQTLAQTEQDYLFVSRGPSAQATRDKRYTSPIQVRTRQGKARFQLSAGPDGMTISSRGELEWKVPPAFPDSQVNVIVNISDATGYELFHAFSITVNGDRAILAEIPNVPPKPVVNQPARENRNLSTHGGKGALALLKSASQSKPVSPVQAETKPNDTLKPGQSKIDLPAPLTDMVVGRGGQYLIMYFQSLKQLKVFDVSSLKFIKSLPVESEDILFTAGAEHLMVVLRDQQKIERWKLDDFQRDLVVASPVDNPIHAAVMGHSSRDLLVLFHGPNDHRQNYDYVDARTMKVLEVERKGAGYLSSRPLLLKCVTASADGRVVTLANNTLIYLESKVEHRQSPRDYGSLILSGGDGTFLYSERGIITNQMEEIIMAAKVGEPARPIQTGMLIPAVQPGYVLDLLLKTPRNARTSDVLAVHLEGELEPLLTLNQVDTSLNKFEWKNPPGMSHYKRFLFFPDRDLLIQVPDTNDRLILHQVPLRELMNETGIDYFYTTSRPETKTEPGKLWKYQIKTVSRKGGVKYELQSGPQGMEISDTGLLTWQVPADIVEPELNVIVQLKDDSTQQLSHRFTLFVPAAIRSAQEQLRKEQERAEAEKKMAAAREAAAREAERLAAREEQNRNKLKRLTESGEAARTQVEQYLTDRLQSYEKEQSVRKLQGYRIPGQETNPYRAWTDTSENEIDARLIKYFADTVILYSRSNQILTIPEESLSKADRDYLDQISKAEIAERKQREKELSDRSLPKQRMIQLWLATQETPSRFGKNNLLGNIQDEQGKPLLSWRVQLLKHVRGGSDLYSLFRHDEPWDSEYNKKLIPLMPAFYGSSRSKAGPGKTNLLAIQAQRPLFSGPGGASLFHKGELPGQTAIIVEAPDALAVEWTKPDDWEYESDKSIEQLFGFHQDGFYALFADGKVELISEKKPLNEISTLLNLKNEPAKDSP
tara:strand:- start:53744 stop:57679 length:3936 start_codon:yes stop_codon:yes gene_type:complete